MFPVNRKTKYLLCLIAIMCVYTCVTAAVVVNHNLHWNVKVEERFYFTMDYREIRNVSVYIEITDLPVIPQDRDTLQRDFPIPACRTCFENGTEFHPSGWLYYWQAAIPIGNWSFLEDIITSQNTDVNIIETDEKWGKRIYNPNLGSMEIAWYKSDGSLSNYTNWSDGFLLTLHRIDSPETLISDDVSSVLSSLILQNFGMLVTGGSFVVIVLISILSIQKRHQYNESCRIEELEHKQALACLMELTKIDKNKEPTIN